MNLSEACGRFAASRRFPTQGHGSLGKTVSDNDKIYWQGSVFRRAVPARKSFECQHGVCKIDEHVGAKLSTVLSDIEDSNEKQGKK